MLVKPKVSNTTLTPADVKQQVAIMTNTMIHLLLMNLMTIRKQHTQRNNRRTMHRIKHRKLSETDSDTDSYSSSVKETIYRAELERRKEERNRYDAFLKKTRREQGYNPLFQHLRNTGDIFGLYQSYRLPAADATAEMTNNPMRERESS
jgi:hypothetical protein